jgi:hypothetical protein
MRPRRMRFPWLALILGSIIGVGGGLYYAWFLNPVNLVNIAPAQLNADDRELYILLISESYLQDGNLARAQARLASLGLHDPAEAVSVLADSAFLSGGDTGQIRALTTLAEALGGAPLAAEVYSGTTAPTLPGITATITATFEAVPSPTPPVSLTPSVTPISSTPTPTALVPTASDLDLLARNVICDDDYPAGRIEVYVNTEFERGIPGVEVHVVADSGLADTFYTGLKPEISPGYADFQMEADQVYSVTLVGLTDPVFGIDSTPCVTGSGQSNIPTYQLYFGPAEETPEPEPGDGGGDEGGGEGE